MGNTLRSIASMEGAHHAWGKHPGNNDVSRYSQYDRTSIRCWTASLKTLRLPSIPKRPGPQLSSNPNQNKPSSTPERLRHPVATC